MFRLNQKGGASVEFAVVLPLLMLLICGTIEFGVLFYNKQVVTNASREAVRAGIAGANNAAMQQIAANYCGNRLIGLKHTITSGAVSVVVAPPDAQNDLTVSVSLNYEFLFGALIGINQTQVSGKTVMRMEPL
jgi:Flp pilus assembly protein TadG